MLRHVSLDSPTPKTPYLTPQNRIFERHVNYRNSVLIENAMLAAIFFFWALGQKIRSANSDFRIHRGRITLETVVSKLIHDLLLGQTFSTFSPIVPKVAVHREKGLT